MNERQLSQQAKLQQQAARSIRLQSEKRQDEIRKVVSNMMNKRATMYD
jgi:hypothetical protein